MMAPGVWVPNQNALPVDCAWQFPDGFGSYLAPEPTKLPLQCSLSPEIQLSAESSPRDSGSISPASTGEPRKAQSAARAAKRQRGRERRKLYKALAHAGKGSDTVEAQRENRSSDFDARAAAVASELKLVVKRTFFDVDTEDLSSSEDEIPLPPAFIKTTVEIDEWRRDYRRFRLGHRQGAKGEITDIQVSEESLTLLGLDLRRCVSA